MLVAMSNNVQSRHLTIHQNYLFEYDSMAQGSANLNIPLGFAHLEGSKMTGVSSVSFSLSFLSSPTMRAEVRSVTLTCSSESHCTFVRSAIKAAANLKVEDLYGFDPHREASDGELLGKGRFAFVRKSWRTGGDKKCAVKVIDKEAFWERVRKGRERKDTLVREISVQAAATYFSTEYTQQFRPVFVKLNGVFESFSHLVIEMELMESDPGDLFRLLKQKNSRLSESDASHYIFDMLWAVKSLQSIGIAHRDIKLANLLITGGNGGDGGPWVKLADFGMSNFAGPDGLLLGRCGTPGYVAPEIFSVGKKIGYKNNVDLFSVGVVMYTLLCGYEPFFGATDAELVESNKRAKVVFDEEDWASVGREAKSLIRRLLDSNPDTRIGVDEALKSEWFKGRNLEHDFAAGNPNGGMLAEGMEVKEMDFMCSIS